MMRLRRAAGSANLLVSQPDNAYLCLRLHSCQRLALTPFGQDLIFTMMNGVAIDLPGEPGILILRRLTSSTTAQLFVSYRDEIQEAASQQFDSGCDIPASLNIASRVGCAWHRPRSEGVSQQLQPRAPANSVGIAQTSRRLTAAAEHPRRAPNRSSSLTKGYCALRRKA